MRALALRLPFHYAWVTITFAIAGIAVADGASFWAIPLYIPAVSDDFEVRRVVIVGAFTAGNVASAAAGPFVGRYIDHHGARRVLIAGSVAMPAMLVLTSRATEPWQLWAGWMLTGASRALIMPLPYNWLMTRWFVGARRRAALGVITIGFGLGGVLILPLLVAIEARIDWSAAMLASAGLVLVVESFVAWLVVRDRPELLGLRPDGAEVAGNTEVEEAESGFTVRLAVRTRTFWPLALGLMVFVIGQGAVIALALDFFESRSVSGGAAVVSAIALIRTIARLPLGLSLARAERVHRLAMMVSLSQGLALVLLLTSTGGVGIVGFVLLWGLAGAFVPMLEPLLVSNAFGTRHFGAVSGTVRLVIIVGQIVGPVGGAALFDATGSYDLPFSLYAVGFVVATVLFGLTSFAVASRAHQDRAAAVGMRQAAGREPEPRQ